MVIGNKDEGVLTSVTSATSVLKRNTFFHRGSPGGTNYRCNHPLVVSQIGEHSPRQKKSRIESDLSHPYNSLYNLILETTGTFGVTVRDSLPWRPRRSINPE
jgi:hypothetical protein